MYHFYALLSRMKLIRRWGLMHNAMPENVAEHTLMTALLAHALASIGREVFGRDVNPEACAARALFHDCAEIFTGDMPTPVKYWSPAIREAYREVEENGSEKLLNMLPPELRETVGDVLCEREDMTGRYVKAADKLSAHIKCIEELRMGNAEFKLAANQTKKKLDEMNCEEAGYFIEKFLPSFTLTLDELE